MRRAICGAAFGLILVAEAGLADNGWLEISDGEAKSALGGHMLVYANGAVQSFSPSGETGYDSGHLQKGRWRIEGSQYCSVWPPSELWVCYGLELSTDGASLRFIAADGSVTIGRYLSK
jgi:hypothetical protein